MRPEEQRRPNNEPGRRRPAQNGQRRATSNSGKRVSENSGRTTSRRTSVSYSEDERIKRRKKKNKRRDFLGKVIPVAVALFLIVLAVGIFYGSKIVQKYKYSGEYADLNEYFGIAYDYEVPLIINNAHAEEKGVYYKNTYYFLIDDVEKYFTDRFYVNVDEQVAIFATESRLIKATLNQSSDFSYYDGDTKMSLSAAPVITNDKKVYVSLEYVKLFSDISVTAYDNPHRLVIYTEDVTTAVATVLKDTSVRYKGGIKSEILEDVVKDEKVYVLEELEDWVKVITDEGMIGYIETKRIEKDNSSKTFTVDGATIVPQFTSIVKDGKINMVFHQIFKKGSGSFSEMSAAKCVTVAAPTWFRIVDNDGNVEGIADSGYVDSAHQNNVEVWALWTDVDNEVDMSGVFHSYDKRQALIQTMISKTLEYDIDGINLDFEKVPAESGDDWAEFLKELSIETHKNNIVLSVDNYAPTASTAHYNRKVQGEVCDYVVVMGYDEHWATSEEAGSVASIGFVEEGIVNTAKSVPFEKIINAVPFYTRVWKTKDGQVSSETLGMGSAKKWCSENGVDLTWDPETCQYYGEIQKNGTTYQIWLEDSESLDSKLSVMKAYDVAGVAEWKLGLDTAEAWDSIEKYMSSED